MLFDGPEPNSLAAEMKFLILRLMAVPSWRSPSQGRRGPA